jgi:S-methylmethionine-dependent homocysteine/selenocysteine methylase
MSKYRHRLPQLDAHLFLTDGGLETTLIFHDGIDLPYFAAFDLLKSDDGRATLRRYFDRYAAIAKARGTGLVLETPTWRANPDWAAKLGYDASALVEVNRRAVDLLLDVRRDHESATTPIVISGNLGPRGDGYVAGKRMSADEAAAYHEAQVATFAQTDADMVAAFTMNYVEEAIGVVRAAQAHAMPVAIAFTVETDGRLPSGMPLAEAIDATDRATGGGPAYHMINCAHPTHFERVIRDDARLRERVRGLRANASKRSHAELDESTDLDAGDPVELGAQYRALRTHLPNLTIVGGCCGTDHRHVDAMGAALAS